MCEITIMINGPIDQLRKIKRNQFLRLASLTLFGLDGGCIRLFFASHLVSPGSSLYTSDVPFDFLANIIYRAGTLSSLLI